MNQNPETAVLGACLLEEKIPDEIRGILTVDMFADSNARIIWEAMLGNPLSDCSNYIKEYTSLQILAQLLSKKQNSYYTSLRR